MLLNEAKNRIPHQQAAKNVSLLNNMVLNLAKVKGFTSLKRATERYGHDCKLLYH